VSRPEKKCLARSREKEKSREGDGAKPSYCDTIEIDENSIVRAEDAPTSFFSRLFFFSRLREIPFCWDSTALPTPGHPHDVNNRSARRKLLKPCAATRVINAPWT
jgi:hypothetical protein